MSLAIGSVSVGLTATAIPLAAVSPGSLTLQWTGAQALTLGGPNVVAGGVGPGQVVIPTGSSVIPLALAGGIPLGSIWGITTIGAGTLNWFYGTGANT